MTITFELSLNAIAIECLRGSLWNTSLETIFKSACKRSSRILHSDSALFELGAIVPLEIWTFLCLEVLYSNFLRVWLQSEHSETQFLLKFGTSTISSLLRPISIVSGNTLDMNFITFITVECSRSCNRLIMLVMRKGKLVHQPFSPFGWTSILFHAILWT